ncbi:MAG: hypothetical protein DSY35_00485 [Desulfurobacterium sp.]|nr:MAG: hypothetical protein DSY35_00485 [Desulfurobacterium sp.]
MLAKFAGKLLDVDVRGMEMPEPKVVVAVGSCACSGGVFRGMYNVGNGVDNFIPVDVYVPGCAARPESIIDGVVKALEILEEKRRDMELPCKCGELRGENNRRKLLAECLRRCHEGR